MIDILQGCYYSNHCINYSDEIKVHSEMSSSDTLNLKDILLSTTDDTYNRKYSHFGRATYYLSDRWGCGGQCSTFKYSAILRDSNFCGHHLPCCVRSFHKHFFSPLSAPQVFKSAVSPYQAEVPH